jgi:hypothetical protein
MVNQSRCFPNLFGFALFFNVMADTLSPLRVRGIGWETMRMPNAHKSPVARFPGLGGDIPLRAGRVVLGHSRGSRDFQRAPADDTHRGVTWGMQ